MSETIELTGELGPPPDCERGLRIILYLAVQAARRHNAKVKAAVEEGKLHPECGLFTREVCYLMSVLPRLQRGGISIEQVWKLAEETP